MHTPMQRKYATGVAHQRHASSGEVHSPTRLCTWSPKGSMSTGVGGCPTRLRSNIIQLVDIIQHIE